MDRVIREIIEAHYDACLARAVHRLQRFPAKDLDCDDSNFRTLWDHWKREMQEQHSYLHGAIETTIEGIVRQVVDQLSHEDGALLTLRTDAFDERDEKPGEPFFDRDAVFAELMNRVNSRACNEPHRREVQRQLDAEGRDRSERDAE